MWMYLRVAECSALFLCQYDLDLNRLPDFYNNLVRSISPKIFEVEIPDFGVWINLCVMECSVLFWVTVALTLNSDLVSGIIVSRAYILYYLR